VEGLAAARTTTSGSPSTTWKLERARIRTGRRIVELHGQLIAPARPCASRPPPIPSPVSPTQDDPRDARQGSWSDAGGRPRRARSSSWTSTISSRSTTRDGHSGGRRGAAPVGLDDARHPAPLRSGGAVSEGRNSWSCCRSVTPPGQGRPPRGCARPVGGRGPRSPTLAEPQRAVTCSLGIGVGDSSHGWDRELLLNAGRCRLVPRQARRS